MRITYYLCMLSRFYLYLCDMTVHIVCPCSLLFSHIQLYAVFPFSFLRPFQCVTFVNLRLQIEDLLNIICMLVFILQKHLNSLSVFSWARLVLIFMWSVFSGLLLVFCPVSFEFSFRRRFIASYYRFCVFLLYLQVMAVI